MKLLLGVDDVPYTYGSSATTTGDVAEILEGKYGVIGSFWSHHQQEGADALAEGMKGSLESLLMGAPPTLDPFGSGTSKIETLFRDFLDRKEIETYGIPGVPTQAALKGVSHRFKQPYKRRPPRPSFIDTGLYQSSFRARVE